MENGVKFWMIGIVVLVLMVPFVVKASLVNRILYSNKSYAKQIEVKTYILTQEQVSDLFRDPSKEPTSLSVDELNHISDIYLIIRAKNNGNKVAWGRLLCKTPGIQDPIQIDLPVVRSFYCIYAVCIADVFISRNKKSKYPDISYEWKELYTK